MPLDRLIANKAASALDAAAFGGINAVLGHFASKDGYARKNRYEVIISSPPGAEEPSIEGGAGLLDVFKGFSSVVDTAVDFLQPKGNEATKSLTFRCNTISIPGQNLRTVEDTTSRSGPPHSIVNGITYGDLQASFYCGSDLREKKFFDTWMNLAYNKVTNNVAYYKEYIGNMEIYQLNEKEERTYGVKLYEVYPTTTSDLAYGHAETNSIHNITVQFKYRYWKDSNDDVGKEQSLLSKLSDFGVNSLEQNIKTSFF